MDENGDMNMELTGEMLIGAQTVRGADVASCAFDPSTGEQMQPAFGGGTQRDVDRACDLAAAAFDAYRSTSQQERARFLEAIAQGILDLGDALIDRAMKESGLPRARLEGERGRTVGQLRLFASLARDGRWIGATLDSAMPERKPLPRPDLRTRKIPLGPVAVFGASNFPLAFSVAGGDTASALAAGCPVIAKAHPSHLGTSELVGRAIQRAVADCGLPEGVFSLLVGNGNAVGEALVAHPAIQAVGFTGSRRGGLALVAIAARRPFPIPVFAEMSSINPVFLLPGALAERSATIAQGLVDSFTLGVGQFCTKPGVVFAVAGESLDRFRDSARSCVGAKASATMLNKGIHAAFCSGAQQLGDVAGVERLGAGRAAEDAVASGAPLFFETSAASFLKEPRLSEEVFGPACLLVVCQSEQEMLATAESFPGQLTATLHLADQDIILASQLLPILERKAGRIVINGFPTGVEVSHAMVHGGPFPATSDSRFTSVGAMAIERFLRPVCYQDLPTALMPESLRDGNPLGIWRLMDGELKRD